MAKRVDRRLAPWVLGLWIASAVACSLESGGEGVVAGRPDASSVDAANDVVATDVVAVDVVEAPDADAALDADAQIDAPDAPHDAPIDVKPDADAALDAPSDAKHPG